jgi:DNA-binding Lrp family transcriptional regulator
MVMTDEKRPRGRPRPKETVDRDNAIYRYLLAEGPKTNNEIMEHFGLPRMIVWLSLDRLRKAGRIRTCAKQSGPGTLWSAHLDRPCP